MTTLTALEGRDLVFSDGSRRTPPKWLTVEPHENGVTLAYTNRNGHRYDVVVPIGQTAVEVANLLSFFERHRETYAPEVPAT